MADRTTRSQTKRKALEEYPLDIQQQARAEVDALIAKHTRRLEREEDERARLLATLPPGSRILTDEEAEAAMWEIFDELDAEEDAKVSLYDLFGTDDEDDEPRPATHTTTHTDNR